MLLSPLYKAPYQKPSVHPQVCCTCTGAKRFKAILELITHRISVPHVVLKRSLISDLHIRDDINNTDDDESETPQFTELSERPSCIRCFQCGFNSGSTFSFHFTRYLGHYNKSQQSSHAGPLQSANGDDKRCPYMIRSNLNVLLKTKTW